MYNIMFPGIEMKHFWLALMILIAPVQTWAQKTPYGSCPGRAQTYQDRYEKTHQSSDLVCFQKALEREMTGKERQSCPMSAQHYQTAYQRNTRSSDLVCFQQALEREMR